MGSNAITIYSAPGYYYALAYCLAATMYSFLNPPRHKGTARWAVPLATTALVFAGGYLTDTGLLVFFLPSLASVLLVVFLLLWYGCRIPVTNAAYFMLRSFVLGEFVASAYWQLYTYMLPLVPSPAEDLLRIMVLAVTYSAVLGLAYVLERGFKPMNENLVVGRKTLIQAVLLALGVYLFSNISNVAQHTPFSSSFPAEILLIRSLVDLGGVFMFYSFHMQMQEVGNRLEIEMLRQMVETQYANFKINEQSVALVNQKYHDLKHQIAYLREEVTADEKRQRLDQMEQEIKAFEAQSHTGNHILDTILSAKLLQCQNQHITMTCVADGSCLSGMDLMDITALFGNALDNAIESLSGQQGKEERLLHVEVGRRKGFAVIVIGNSCPTPVTFQNGLPQTSKADRRLHGYGTKSIAATARKYGGTATFTAEAGWFELKVVLPENRVKGHAANK